MAIDKFYQIKVRKPGSDKTPVTITCVDPILRADIEGKALAEGFEIVDVSPAYVLYRDLENAMSTIRMFCD